jgi:hypothetical protein
VLRISGYGQTGPYRDRPGFGVVGEAMGGLRHLTGEPGRVPVRVGVSIGDTLAALHGVIGILLALQERQRSGEGQVIDVALYEAVFNCMESLLPEYSAFGAVRGRRQRLPGIAPTNAYLCSDGGYALIAGNGDSIFKRLMAVIGRTTWARPGTGRQRRPRARVAESMRPSASGAASARRRSAGRRWTRRGAGRPHLHRGRHRGRPALRRARHAEQVRWTTAACCGARHRAQALAHARRPPPQRADAWGRTPTPCCASSGLPTNRSPGSRAAASSRETIMSKRIYFNEVATRDGFQIEPASSHRRQGRAGRRAERMRLRQDRGHLVHLAQGDPDAARRRGGDGPHPPRARRGVHGAGAQPARRRARLESRPTS